MGETRQWELGVIEAHEAIVQPRLEEYLYGELLPTVQIGPHSEAGQAHFVLPQCIVIAGEPTLQLLFLDRDGRHIPHSALLVDGSSAPMLRERPWLRLVAADGAEVVLGRIGNYDNRRWRWALGEFLGEEVPPNSAPHRTPPRPAGEVIDLRRQWRLEMPQ
jgi:hypothetical protein